MAPKLRLTRAFFLLSTVFSLSSIVVMAVLWINYEFVRSGEESRRTSEDYFDSVENAISVETDRVVDYLEAQTSSNQVKFYLNVKNRVEAIHDLLSGVHAERGERLDTAEARESLLSLLRHLSYDGGRGGYFFSAMDGTILVDGTRGPESTREGDARGDGAVFEPKPLSQAVKSVAIIGEGFFRLPLAADRPEGPDRARDEVPVTFLKKFAPLDWVVGASEYYSNFEKELGGELIGWVDNAPLPPEESLLVLDYEGRVLSYRDPTMVGLNVFENDRGTGLMRVAARTIRGAKERSKGFLRLNLKPSFGAGSEAGAEYVAYFRAVPGWRWVVVNFVNIAELDEALRVQRRTLESNLRQTVGKVLATTAGVLIVIVIISTIISRKAGSSLSAFFHFFDKAATSSIEMDPLTQPFQEFARLAQAANSMIRERREADRKLSDSELRFRTFFNVCPEIITILDDAGRIVECNREFEKFAETTAEAAQGRSLGEAIGVGDRDWRRQLAELSEKGQIDGRELVVERGGRRTFLLVFSKLMPFLDEKLILWVGVNVTAGRQAELEKAALEEKLSRSRTMEAMGRMAASVAHELNNILSALIGYPELLLKDGNLQPAQRAQIAEIMDAGHRASAVVGDLLTLSRGVATAKVAVDLNDLADKTVQGPVVARALAAAKQTVTIGTNLTAKAVVKASPTHLRKVVQNLVQNAIEVLAERGGRVEVSTSVQRPDGEPGPGADPAACDHVVLEVSDDGPGVAESDLAHIFEPFYSKKPGSGHGLGLALVELTVKEHGGRVQVDTSPRGTSFKVILPAAAPADKPSGDARRAQLKGRGQKILVVDDVDIQRKLAQRMLRTLGYDPHAVSSGEEAVVYLKDNDVDLIILDMIMDPGINGRQTYEAILSFKPWQKAIIASGLAENDEVARAQALGASHFVSKPYTLEDIAGAVHKALHPDGP